MKKHLLSLFVVLLPLLASAEKVEIDGLWYNLTKENKTAEITSSPTKYSGDLVIPETVMYGEEEYNVTSIGNNAFASCSSLSSIIIPQGVTQIGNNAFFACHSLSSIIIPKGVKSIGSNALYNCQTLTTIILPEGLEKISSSAFAFCSMLREVYCYAENAPSAEPNAFDGSNLRSAVLHVSTSCIDNYKATSPWNKFSNFEAEVNKSVGVQGTFDLNGRNISSCGLPVPTNTTQDEGRVVVNITVNPAGEVIATSINRRSNTVSPDLRKAAEDAAKRANFNKIDGKDVQSGTITYYFKLR